MICLPFSTSPTCYQIWGSVWDRECFDQRSSWKSTSNTWIVCIQISNRLLKRYYCGRSSKLTWRKDTRQKWPWQSRRRGRIKTSGYPSWNGASEENLYPTLGKMLEVMLCISCDSWHTANGNSTTQGHITFALTTYDGGICCLTYF